MNHDSEYWRAFYKPYFSPLRYEVIQLQTVWIIFTPIVRFSWSIPRKNNVYLLLLNSGLVCFNNDYKYKHEVTLD